MKELRWDEHDLQQIENHQLVISRPSDTCELTAPTMLQNLKQNETIDTI